MRNLDLLELSAIAGGARENPFDCFVILDKCKPYPTYAP